jgi:hypothetical protein
MPIGSRFARPRASRSGSCGSTTAAAREQDPSIAPAIGCGASSSRCWRPAARAAPSSCGCGCGLRPMDRRSRRRRSLSSRSPTCRPPVAIRRRAGGRSGFGPLCSKCRCPAATACGRSTSKPSSAVACGGRGRSPRGRSRSWPSPTRRPRRRRRTGGWCTSSTRVARGCTNDCGGYRAWGCPPCPCPVCPCQTCPCPPSPGRATCSNGCRACRCPRCRCPRRRRSRRSCPG